MSSLGIFDKETKTYKKVAGTAEAAAVDGSMSDTSTNPVQNKVVKKYVDDHAPNITVDTALSSTSTNPVQNKVVTSNLTDIRKETTVNLLNPTLQTTTQNGVTCTNNGDGTYTLNGTASMDTYFYISGIITNKDIINKCEGSKLVCSHSGLSYESSSIYAQFDRGLSTQRTFTEGAKFNNIKGSETLEIIIAVISGKTVSNITFKPMITTDLSATYDDFVPYTGDTGRLNGDVAELKAEVANNKTVVDTSMSDTSTNPVQNMVIKKYVDKTQTGYYVGSNPPKNTSILWIDSSHGGMTKYYCPDTMRWHPVRAKGYDSPVNLINENYWNVFPDDQHISISGLSAIYDMNAGKIILSIDKLSVSADPTWGPSAMVNIVMNEFNVGNTGTIAAVSSSGPHDLEMKLSYPHGYIQLKGGGPYATYASATFSSIKFEFTYN